VEAYLPENGQSCSYVHRNLSAPIFDAYCCQTPSSDERSGSTSSSISATISNLVFAALVLPSKISDVDSDEPSVDGEYGRKGLPACTVHELGVTSERMKGETGEEHEVAKLELKDESVPVAREP
jgi:hypothetical protein